MLCNNIKLTYSHQVLWARREAGSTLRADLSLFFREEDEVTPCQIWTHLMPVWAQCGSVSAQFDTPVTKPEFIAGL